MSRRFLPVLLVLAWLLLPSGTLAQDAQPVPPTTTTTSFPLTVTDDAGVATTFRAAPRRIVSLNPGHTESIFALGAGDRVVGVDVFSTYPPEAGAVQPRLTTYPRPSIEAIVNLQPDLVVALVESEDTLAPLRQLGVPVLKLFPRDFDATVQAITLLGQVLDANDRAAGIAEDMRARRDTVVRSIADAPRPRVFYELDASDPTKPYTAGSGGFYGQLIDVAGGANVFGDVRGDFAQVSAEAVIDRNPELIVLTDAYLPYNPQTPALVAARPGWGGITAVQNGATYAVQAELFSSPGPRLIEGLEALAYLLHPDRFAASGGPRLSTTGSVPFCAAGQTPTFTFGFATLAEALGPGMGDPTECAHVDPTNGDTYQQTTKGLAIYRRATNTPLLTSGSERWAATADGVVPWSGAGLDPPAAR